MAEGDAVRHADNLPGEVDGTFLYGRLVAQRIAKPRAALDTRRGRSSRRTGRRWAAPPGSDHVG